MNENTNDRPPAWNELPAPVQIVTTAGPTLHVTATRLFRHLEDTARAGAPILQMRVNGRHASEASVGALNLYLGTAGLRGLARRLGVSYPRTRWDWEHLAALVGFTDECAPLRRAG